MSTSVLLVEDDPSIGTSIAEAVTGFGYQIRWCTTGAEAIDALTASIPDVVLLDAGLPDIDGFLLCRSIRERFRDLPIILVTARDQDIDVVVGLDSGANDYVTKPFSIAVLMARIRAHARHVDIVNGPVRVGDVDIDVAGYVVRVRGGIVDLRRREFELLLCLARSVGKVVTRERILAEVWNLHWESSTKTVEMHVLALRKKLGDDIDIASVRGVGYRLMAP